MGKLDDIRNKLQAGSTTKQLVEQGYAKSSVHHVAKKLEKLQPSPATLPVPDEIQELRHQKEIMKLKKEIAEIEAGKERLPERVTELERALQKTKDSILDIWIDDILEHVINRLSCPKHDHTMGLVFKCSSCDYEQGLGWSKT